MQMLGLMMRLNGTTEMVIAAVIILGELPLMSVQMYQAHRSAQPLVATDGVAMIPMETAGQI
jgi:hypothetical protein